MKRVLTFEVRIADDETSVYIVLNLALLSEKAFAFQQEAIDCVVRVISAIEDEQKSAVVKEKDSVNKKEIDGEEIVFITDCKAIKQSNYGFLKTVDVDSFTNRVTEN